MRSVFSLFIILLVAGCYNEKDVRIPSAVREDFFKQDEDTLQKIQEMIRQFDKLEKIEKVQSISYIDSKDKSYAIVFYKSDKGIRNIVIKRQFENGRMTEIENIRCEGTCTCKVDTIVDNEGNVTVKCSCLTCTMVIDP